MNTRFPRVPATPNTPPEVAIQNFIASKATDWEFVAARYLCLFNKTTPSLHQAEFIAAIREELTRDYDAIRTRLSRRNLRSKNTPR